MSLVTTLGGKKLQKNTQKVMSTLLKSAAGGDAKSARLVVEMAGRVPAAAEPNTTESGRSQALAWAEEPAWIGDLSEEMSETATGSREPEDY